MSEHVFYENGEVRVTNARFIVGSQTYAMSGVTSVKSHVTPAARGGGIAALIIGLLIFAIAEGSGKLLGLVIFGVGALLVYNAKATHSVVLSSASGEAQALSSTDAPYIRSVVDALNDALIHRG